MAGDAAFRMFNDIRLLRLAIHLEEMYEKYEEYLRDLIPEGKVRAKLAALFLEGPAHERLRRAHASVERRVRPAQLSTAEILQTLLDAERGSQAFYRDHLDDLSDPTLVDLFKDMAAEEAHHAAAVQEAMSRRTLSACVRQALSVRELEHATGLPQASVYRHVSSLAKGGLLEVERSALTPDGKRYELYRSRLRAARIEVDEAGVRLLWEGREDGQERLATAWSMPPAPRD